MRYFRLFSCLLSSIDEKGFIYVAKRSSFYFFKGVASLKSQGVKKTYLKSRNVLLRYINKDTLEHQKLVPDGSLVAYEKWISENNVLSPLDAQKATKAIQSFELKPVFSIVMPVYNTNLKHLRVAIESVLSQWYPYFELCIADDNSSNLGIKPLLQQYSEIDDRVKVVFRRVNGNISLASNSALEIAKGDYVVLMDHDDILSADALFCLAKTINERGNNVDLIYSDEDKLDENGNRVDPFFKPDWNYCLFLQQNFVAHLGCYKSSIAKKIGGFRKGYEGSQDYDFTLRFIREAKGEIVHIPRVLYHWRKNSSHLSFSTTQQKRSDESAFNALNEFLSYAKMGVTKRENFPGVWKLQFYNETAQPKISIFIPTRDHYKDLKRCLDSILSRTSYSNYEIIIIDNGSTEPDTLAYLKELSVKFSKIRIVKDNSKFNYSKLNNKAAKIATGEYYLLLNNDVEIIQKDWLNVLVSKFCLPLIGIVGCKLLYPDNRIQHAGVVVGGYYTAFHNNKFDDSHSSGYFGNLILDREVSAVTGACLLIKAKLFESLNGLDELNFAVSFNDVDLCLRARKFGYKVLWTPDVTLFHYESVSRGKDDTFEKKQLNYDERKKFILQYGTFKDPFFNINLDIFNESPIFSQQPRNQKPWVDYIDILCPFHRGDVLVALSVANTLNKLGVKPVLHISKKLYDWVSPFLYDFELRPIDVDLPPLGKTFEFFTLAKEKLAKDPLFSGKMVASHTPLGLDLAGVNIAESMLLQAGVPIDTKLLRIPSLIENKGHVPLKRILLHPHGSWALKSLPERIISRIVKIAHKYHIEVVQIGGPYEKSLPCVDGYIFEDFNLIQWKKIFEDALCLVGIDSWPVHFANMIDKDYVVFYGSTRSRDVNPISNFEKGNSSFLVFETTSHCSPCNSYSCIKKLENCEGYCFDELKFELFLRNQLRK